MASLFDLPRPLLLGLSLGTVLALGACDDDEPAVIPLTASEAELLGVGMWRGGWEVGVSIPVGFGTAARLPLAAQTVDYDDEIVVSCGLGGQVTNALSIFAVVNQETGAGEASITNVQTHEACTFQEGGTTFTVNGAPGVTTVWEFEGDGAGNTTFTGSITGAVDASVGESSGLCPVDLGFDGALTGGTQVDLSIAGDVCGQAVSRTLSVTAS
jgi:hypothetical protein